MDLKEPLNSSPVRASFLLNTFRQISEKNKAMLWWMHTKDWCDDTGKTTKKNPVILKNKTLLYFLPCSFLLLLLPSFVIQDGLPLFPPKLDKQHLPWSRDVLWTNHLGGNFCSPIPTSCCQSLAGTATLNAFVCSPIYLVNSKLG